MSDGSFVERAVHFNASDSFSGEGFIEVVVVRFIRGVVVSRGGVVVRFDSQGDGCRVGGECKLWRNCGVDVICGVLGRVEAMRATE